MIKVTANEFIKPECVEAFLAVAKELVEKTNGLDSGCIKYELCMDKNDPLHFVMLEEWADQESLDVHMKAEHFVELVPKLSGFTSKPTEIALLEKVY